MRPLTSGLCWLRATEVVRSRKMGVSGTGTNGAGSVTRRNRGANFWLPKFERNIARDRLVTWLCANLDGE